MPQQHSSGRPGRPPVYQGGRPFLLSQHLGPGFPSGLHREPENQRRQTVGRKHSKVLEGHGHAGLSPVGQCADLPRQYPLSSIFWSGNQTVPVLRRHASVHSHRGTLAQRGDRKLQRHLQQEVFQKAVVSQLRQSQKTEQKLPTIPQQAPSLQLSEGQDTQRVPRSGPGTAVETACCQEITETRRDPGGADRAHPIYPQQPEAGYLRRAFPDARGTQVLVCQSRDRHLDSHHVRLYWRGFGHLVLVSDSCGRRQPMITQGKRCGDTF